MVSLETLKEITKTYLPLAITTFGGPSAHIALFHDIFVTKKKWVSDKVFTELFAIAQSLPGPASTQLAYSITLMKDGVFAAVYSFFLWSFPGMVLMTLVGLGILQFSSGDGNNHELPLQFRSVENGLTSCAVGLVAVAAIKLSGKLLDSKLTIFLALTSFACTIQFVSWPWLSPTLMTLGGLTHFVYDYFFSPKSNATDNPSIEDEESQQPLMGGQQRSMEDQDHAIVESTLHHHITPSLSLIMILIWLLLMVLSVYARTSLDKSWSVFGTFYFTGSIIFGGGPVVIPLLNAYVVSNGWLSENEFLIGLAIIQAIPGPMFNFAAYCGALALRDSTFSSVYGATLAWLGIFIPGLLLKTALIPLWTRYRSLSFIQKAMKGINAVAVGLVYAAVFLLWNRAIAASNDADKVLGNYPQYVIIAAASFVGVGFLNQAAPLTIFLSGLTGYFI